MDRETIEELEDRFRFPGFIEWVDMDYAYAYEGVILPGGKIMMGRWWRCGMFGVGDGMELGADGGPIEVVDDNEDEATDPMDVDGDDSAGPSDGAPSSSATTTNNTRNGKLERGPFVFWC
jgi:hypothetical protein